MAGTCAAVSGKDQLQDLLDKEENILRRVFNAKSSDAKSLLEDINRLIRGTDGGDDTYNLKVSLRELREIAYDTEDLLDELMFLSGKYGRQGTNFLSRAVQSIKYLSARCRVFMQVREMRARHRAIKQRNSTLTNFSDRETPANLTRYRLDEHQLAPLFFEEADFVGTDEPKKDMIQLLMAAETNLKVISVVGMPGSGKTTLLRSIFNHEKVRGSFKDHVWIIVTPEFSIKELLRSTLNQIFEERQEPMPESTNIMDEFQLVEMITRCLKDRKYIIVFDDVWSSGFWEYFKYALPDNNCGSRVVVAARSAEVVSAFKVSTDNSWSEAKKGLDSHSKDVHHYYLNPLPHNYAWSLFCKKAFHSDSCPPELENLSREIIEKCSGLPLVIVAIGGLLSTKERNVEAWKGMLESLDWENGSTEFKHFTRIEKAKIPEVEHAMAVVKDEVPKIDHVTGVPETEHVIGVEKGKGPEIEHVGKMDKIKVPKLEHVMRILSISYKDLPYHLKSCFLYFNMFPKNFSIKRVTLIRLWIAEGFVKSEKGKTLEDIAVGYLKELIQRSMVQVSEFYDYGRVRSCRIHNLFREIIILKSEEENFGSSLTREIKKFEGTVRRLSVLEANDDLLQNMSASYLRALLIFGSNAISFPSMLGFFCRFKLLRILDLEGAPIETLPKDFGNLLHLRYLSLRNTGVSKLPKSLRRLINLQTLDLKGTYVSELPSQIIKLKSLRHLLAYRYYIGREPPYYYALGIKLPQGIGKLGELQKLIYIDVNQESGVFRELARLTQLRRLGIVNLRKQDGEKFSFSVSKMKELRALLVSSIYIDQEHKHEELDLQSFAPPEKLERLYLRGPLDNLPPWVSSLNQLVRLRLRWSNLAEDSLKVLHVLPRLIELTLIQAYEGKRLSFNQGFPELKILSLDRLANLESVSLEGAMPNLQKIYIRSCEQLITVPEGIEQRSSLKELHLFDMHALMHMLGEGEAESLKVKNIPVIRSYHNQDRAYKDI